MGRQFEHCRNVLKELGFARSGKNCRLSDG